MAEDRINWAVGITECPRDGGVSYLDATLAGLMAAGMYDARPHLFVDETRSLGSYGSFKRALAGLSGTSSADLLLVVQDDVQLSRNLFAYLDTDDQFRCLIQNPGIFSLYTAGPHHCQNPGWNELAPRVGANCFGALAIAMTPQMAADFLASNVGAGVLTRTDNWLGEYCKQFDFPYWMHSPSFARHLGEVSAISNPWPEEHRFFRQAGVFCEDCRALNPNLSTRC